MGGRGFIEKKTKENKEDHRIRARKRKTTRLTTEEKKQELERGKERPIPCDWTVSVTE
jgi:hypothetical protein